MVFTFLTLSDEGGVVVFNFFDGFLQRWGGGFQLFVLPDKGWVRNDRFLRCNKFTAPYYDLKFVNSLEKLKIFLSSSACTNIQNVWYSEQTWNFYIKPQSCQQFVWNNVIKLLRLHNWVKSYSLKKIRVHTAHHVFTALHCTAQRWRCRK